MYPEESQRRQSWQPLSLIVGALIAAAGCSLTPGNTGLGTADKLLPIVPGLRHAPAETEGLAKELAKTTHEPYAVEQGDVLLIQPTDLESNVRLPPDQPVLADGSVDLGEYGRIVVIGMTLPEIEALAQKTIEQATKETTKVHVRLVERVSKVFYVLGEVNAPGYYTATGRETVLDAILIAGGLTDQASRKNIIVSRPTPPHDCRVVLPVCYNHIVQIGDTTTNYQIFPGDRIFVPAKSMWERCRKKNPDPCECLPQCKAVLGGPSGCRDVADKKLEPVQIAERITSKTK